ncbi:hypothetical protein PHYBOEH_009288 [Phytophthora boehmeriae]|uniref:Peptidase A1 domain-containing protein n=1 Tax=Phytophthora boehmeriae TaxID=109152 RepID=A0A8T1X5T5_9STRA|nr:hypothetical protein PHYBOEH_009288 [Phytophthora boehmeriae]
MDMLLLLLLASVVGSTCSAFARIALSVQPRNAAMMQERQTSRLRLGSVRGDQFFGSVSVGTPPQTFRVLLDTGSSDAWLPDASCSTCGQHSRFHRQLSSSFRPTRQRFQGVYGSGDSFGIVGVDVFTFGNVAVPDLAFAMLSEETGDIPTLASDGVIGLAFAGMSNILHAQVLLDAVSKLDPQMKSVFAFYLAKDAPEFHFGGYDLGVVGEGAVLAKFPVLILPIATQLTYWTIAINDFHLVRQVGGQVGSNLCDPFCYAIIDTGSSFTYVPPKLYDSVIAEVTRGKVCDLEQLTCDGVGSESFPTLSFSFGSASDGNFFQLPPRSYVDCNNGTCDINLLNHGTLGEELFWWVLGDNFVQAYYTVFDFEKLQYFKKKKYSDMDKSECALCHRRRGVFSCASCTSAMLQQRRTMLSALQADVAVLRKKTGFALNTKSALVDAEQRLDKCMQQVEQLAERVMKTRERLCSERIAVVERTSKLEDRTEKVEDAQHKLKLEAQRAESLHAPVLECLDYQVQWADENAAKVRGDRLRELFALFGLTPEEPTDDANDDDDPLSTLPDEREGVSEEIKQRKARQKVPVFFRTIVGLPLPISGRYDNVPPEVVSAALSKIIHLLHCLVKYLKITYPHPMEFNGSFSTIGNTSEGAGCHTLYPDGSDGFDRGVDMLLQNVAFLCMCQGVTTNNVHPTDMLGNLLQVYKSTRLGTLCDNMDGNEFASKHMYECMR